jgi:hypothetical protein
MPEDQQPGKITFMPEEDTTLMLMAASIFPAFYSRMASRYGDTPTARCDAVLESIQVAKLIRRTVESEK